MIETSAIRDAPAAIHWMSPDIFDDSTDDGLTTHNDKEHQRLVGVYGEFGQLAPLVFNDVTRQFVGNGYHCLTALKDALPGEDVLVMIVHHDRDMHILRSIAHEAQYSKPNKEAVTAALTDLDQRGIDCDYAGLPVPQLERMLGIREPITRNRKRCPKCGEDLP